MNLHEQIEKADYFTIMFTPEWENDPICLEQFFYARNLGKSMVIIKSKNLTIPEYITKCDIIAEIEADLTETEKIVKFLKNIIGDDMVVLNEFH